MVHAITAKISLTVKVNNFVTMVGEEEGEEEEEEEEEGEEEKEDKKGTIKDNRDKCRLLDTGWLPLPLLPPLSKQRP